MRETNNPRRKTLARLASLFATGGLMAASMMVFTGATALAGAPKGGGGDSCGYPTGTVPRPNTTFNENEIMRYSALTADGKGVFLLYNDEHTLTLGQGAISPWSPTYTSGLLKADQKDHPSIGDPLAHDASGRPIYPAAFVTDLGATSSPGVGSNPTNKDGDWQSKPVGTVANSGANTPSFIAGTWKAYAGPGTNTGDTVKNNYFMGPNPPADVSTPSSVGGTPVPAGLTNQGFGADIRWTFADLRDKDGNALTAGHTYRIQFMAHDGDQNQTTTLSGGDVGEGCAVFDIARPPATPAIVTTAHNAVLPTGTISDTAVLSSAFVASGVTDIGNIIFKVYTSSDCTTGLVGTKTVTDVPGNGSYPSGAVTVTTAGTYYWQVSFISANPGNNGNANAIGICGDQTGGNQERSVVTNLGYEKKVSLSAAGPFSHNVVAAPGDILYWQITITNTNDVAALGIEVHDIMSKALVDNSAAFDVTTCNSTCTKTANADGTVTINWAGVNSVDVPASGTKVLTFNVTLNSTISATVTLDNFVVSPTDNCVAGSTDPKCVTTTDVPMIDIQKDPNNQSAPVGGTASFTITVKNTGNVTLTDVVVTDAQASGCAADKTKLPAATFAALGSMAPGATVTYTCTKVTVAGDFTNGVFTNHATACGVPPHTPPATVCDTDTADVGLASLHSKQDFVPNDTATLAGLTSPTTLVDNLTIALYKGTICAPGDLLFSDAFKVNANTDFSTANTALLSALLGSTNTGGTFSWKITYAGDALNAAINGGCGDENFVVTNN